MELFEYPRPANDTGIGIHWSAGFPAAIGLGKIRDYWIPEMREMGITWVKIANHDGALPLVELLLDQGFMPIVRIYRPAPNPGHLSADELAMVRDFIQAGARYIEFNNEPDLGIEWEDGQVPPNALDIVAENAIIDMDAILELGGMPAVPAVATGSKWDIVGKIVQKGRADLFDGPVWQAVHNYSVNHPLDYPYDSGNQEGAPYTREFYEAVKQERWDGSAWGGRSLEEINRIRAENSNPGDTIMEDASCWLAFQRFDALTRQHVGRSIPILSTENGYLVGENADPRYPATTPDLHMAQTLEACRVMMGTSNRFPSAPDYYFCTAFWLIGNFELGSSSPWWEGQAWYSQRWPNGKLPIVQALKSEPKRARQWQGAPLQNAVVQGVVLHPGAHRTVALYQQSAAGETLELARAELNDRDRYRFADVKPGRYVVEILGADARQEIVLAPDQRIMTVNFNLAEPSDEVSGKSMLHGVVSGGANATLVLVNKKSGASLQTVTRMDGSFRFVDLPAGKYSLTVEQPRGSRLDDIVLDGEKDKEVSLAVAGWGHVIRLEGNSPGFGVIRCSVEGQKGLFVWARANGWKSNEVRTGSKPEYGPFACEIAPLGPGEYTVQVRGLKDAKGKPLQLQAPVPVDLEHVSFIVFEYNELAEEKSPQMSAVTGRVVNGAGLTVVLLDKQANRLEQTIGADERFAFRKLGAGMYTLVVSGWEELTGHSRIALDGVNEIALDLVVPEASPPQPEAPTASVILGTAPGAAGQVAVLTDDAGGRYEQEVGQDDRFRFEGLPAGVYTLSVPGGYLQRDLMVDGENGLEVTFSPLEPQWIADVRPAGRGPGFSIVRAEVMGRLGWPVRIHTEGWPGIVRQTGSKREYGEFALEFSPLGAGRYIVEPEKLGVQAEVQLTGREVVMVTFRRGGGAVGPTQVRPIPANHPPSTQPEPAAPPSTPSRPPRFEHVLLVTWPLDAAQDVRSLLRYAEQFQPHVGDSLDDALVARHVTVVGGSDAEIQAITSKLAEANVGFDTVSDGIAQELERRIQGRKPW